MPNPRDESHENGLCLWGRQFWRQPPFRGGSTSVDAEPTVSIVFSTERSAPDFSRLLPRKKYILHAKIEMKAFFLTARIIFSLSARAASLLAGSGAPLSYPAHDSSSRMLRPRLLCLGSPFALAASEHASPALSFTPAPDATFALAALTATPFRRSLCRVTSLVAVDSIERRHQREFLRC